MSRYSLHICLGLVFIAAGVLARARQIEKESEEKPSVFAALKVSQQPQRDSALRPHVLSDGRQVFCDTFGVFTVSPAGSLIWSYDSSPDFLGPCAVSSTGVVFQSTNDGAIIAFDEHGKEKWAINATSSYQFWSPVAANNEVVWAVMQGSGAETTAIRIEAGSITKRVTLPSGARLYEGIHGMIFAIALRNNGQIQLLLVSSERQ